ASWAQLPPDGVTRRVATDSTLDTCARASSVPSHAISPALARHPLEKDDTVFVVPSDVILGARGGDRHSCRDLLLMDGRLEHRGEGLEHQRVLLPREVGAEEQDGEVGTGRVPAPKSPLRLCRGAVDDQLLE